MAKTMAIANLAVEAEVVAAADVVVVVQEAVETVTAMMHLFRIREIRIAHRAAVTGIAIGTTKAATTTVVVKAEAASEEVVLVKKFQRDLMKHLARVDDAVVIGIVHTTARVDDTRTKTAVMVVEAVSATRGMSAEVKMKSTTTRAVGYTHVYGYV